MLGLPSSTEVNSRVTKEKLYANLNVTTQVSEMIKNQISSIIWRNKLADNTIGVAAGETVKEIQVFEITLRQRELDKRVLSAIAKAIPYKILFILTFEKQAQGWIEILNTFYHSEWIGLVDMKLRIEGLNLDTVYESIVRQIAGGRLDKEVDIVDAVRRDKELQRLTREITALEKKMLCEKQFNRQVEMHNKLKKLRRELEELKDGQNEI